MIDSSIDNMFESTQGHHDLFDHDLHHSMFQDTSNGQHSPREFAGHSPIPDLHHIDFHLDTNLDMPFEHDDHSNLHDISAATTSQLAHDVLTSSNMVLEDTEQFAHDTHAMLDTLHHDHLGLSAVLDPTTSIHNFIHQTTTSAHLGLPNFATSSLVHPFPFGHLDEDHLQHFNDDMMFNKLMKKNVVGGSPTSQNGNGTNGLQNRNLRTGNKKNTTKVKNTKHVGGSTKKSTKRKSSLKSPLGKGMNKLQMGGTGNKFSKSGSASPRKRHRGTGASKKMQGKPNKHPKLSIETSSSALAQKVVTPGSSRSTASNGSQSLKPKQTSYFRGVSCCGKDRKWQARIRDANRVRYLGRYPTEVEAALVYDRAARECKGVNAPTNFILLDKETTEKLKAAYIQYGEVPLSMHELLAKSMRPRVENAIKKRTAAAIALKASNGTTASNSRYTNTRSGSQRPAYNRSNMDRVSKTPIKAGKLLHTPPSQAASGFFPVASTKQLNASTVANKDSLMLKSSTALNAALLNEPKRAPNATLSKKVDTLHSADVKVQPTQAVVM